MKLHRLLLVFAASVSLSLFGCKDNHDHHGHSHGHGHDHGHSHGEDGHHHEPPHGGAPVVLGDEAFHLEFVRDEEAGKLQAYVMDGHMEEFVRIKAASFKITVDGEVDPAELELKAVANEATGEVVGDTALFEVQADWIKTTTNFSATIPVLELRGKKYENVKFKFPEGNE